MPDKSITAAGNTVVPALLALEGLGFEVTTQSSSVGETTIAVRGEEKYVAEDPVTVLGLIKLIELRTWQWGASDSEIEKTLHKYRLDDLIGSQCIMKERPASEGRSRMRRRLRCAALCRASLRYGGAWE